MSSSKFLLDISREYSLYVCSYRAIPRVDDGLKHSQRIALYLVPADKIKTVALSGTMAAKNLYVHGDASANNAINLLCAPYSNNIPLMQGHGQFGSRTCPGAEGIGAPRYTSVSRSKAAEHFLYVDSDIVPMQENFDGSNMEPVHFLPLIPVVLLNGVEGIAVGHSTYILPRSFKGLVEATQDALNGKKTLRGLAPHFERYDVGVRQLASNQYEFTGKAKIEDTSSVRIVELPPGMAIDVFRKRLNAMEENDQILNYFDRSTSEIDILVKFKRGSVKEWTEQDAIEFFKMREKVTERIVVLNWGGKAIRTYADPADLVREFAEWRLGWYTTRFEKLLKDASHELIYWRLIKELFVSGFTKKLGAFSNRAAMSDAVVAAAKKAKIDHDDGHLDRVLSLATYRWTKEFEANVGETIADLEKDIAAYQEMLGSPEKIKATYISELEALKKLKF